MMISEAAAHLASMPPLAGRLDAFMRTLPGAEPIDDLPGLPPASKRADFLLADRTCIVEVKNLTSDVSHQIGNVLARYRDRPEFPRIYGTVELECILRSFPAERESIRRQIAYRLTKSLERDVRLADEQIGQTKTVFGIPDAAGLLVIANQIVDALPPDIILRRINEMLLRKDRFSQIAWALIIYESHMVENFDGCIGPGTMLLQGPAASTCSGCCDYVRQIPRRWAAFNNMPYTEGRSNSLSPDLLHPVKSNTA